MSWIVLLLTMMPISHASWYQSMLDANFPNPKVKWSESDLQKAICRRQLRQRMVPTACYGLVARLPMVKRKSLHETLDKACRTAKLSHASVEDLSDWLKAPLSKNCHAYLEKTRGIRIYQGEEGNDWPES